MMPSHERQTRGHIRASTHEVAAGLGASPLRTRPKAVAGDGRTDGDDDQLPYFEEIEEMVSRCVSHRKRMMPMKVMTVSHAESRTRWHSTFIAAPSKQATICTESRQRRRQR